MAECSSGHRMAEGGVVWRIQAGLNLKGQAGICQDEEGEGREGRQNSKDEGLAV